VKSADSFDDFFERHYVAVWRLVRVMVADPDQAEDVTQEAFATAAIARYT
jgi:DNA-directed RNA polymerase specialized sigma24 family protein